MSHRVALLGPVLLAAVIAATLGTAGDDQPKPNPPPIPSLLWKLDLASPSYGSGALGDLDTDGKLAIVFGTYFNDGHLYCVNAKDGTVRWKFKSEGGPFDASV